MLKLIRQTEITLGPMIAVFYPFLFGLCCAGMFYCTGIPNFSYPALLLFCLNVMLQGLAAALLLSYIIRFQCVFAD